MAKNDDKKDKDDLFADERIVVSVEASVGSDLGLYVLKRAVPTQLARKIIKLMLKTPRK